MGAGGSDCDVPDEVIREYSKNLRQDTRTTSYFFKPELPNPDDTSYNQNWWREYCKDNNLDINTGKRLR